MTTSSDIADRLDNGTASIWFLWVFLALLVLGSLRGIMPTKIEIIYDTIAVDTFYIKGKDYISYRCPSINGYYICKPNKYNEACTLGEAVDAQNSIDGLLDSIDGDLDYE